MIKKNTDHFICQNDQDLIALAAKCKFITPEQENTLLTNFLSNAEKDPDYNVAQVFETFKFISREEFEFLLSIKKHLINKQLDVKFGKLAVANQITTADVIKKALDQQVDHFRKTREHIPLGDILVKNKKISEKDKTAILLTQDRIADEFLADAMNRLMGN